MSIPEILHKLLIQRSSLSIQEKDLKARLDEWKEEALPLLMATNTKSFGDESIGTMTVVEGSSSSINRDMLIQNLLAEGIEADRVAAIVDKSTKRGTYTTIQFKKRNGR